MTEERLAREGLLDPKPSLVPPLAPTPSCLHTARTLPPPCCDSAHTLPRPYRDPPPLPCRDPAQVFVKFGNAGLHTLEPSSDQQTLAGSRDRDGDPCSATLVQ